MNLDYNKLNNIYYEDNHIIWYLKFKSYSPYADEQQWVFAFENTKKYPEANMKRDMVHVLNCLKKGYPLDKIYSELDILTEIQNELISQNLIVSDSADDVDVNSEVMKLNNSQLLDLLKKYGIKSSGKRKKLVKLAIENIPSYEFDNAEFEITPDGEEFLAENEWIRYYDFALTSFIFDDFYMYIEENDGETFDLVLDFIDKHFEIAKHDEKFGYYDACLKAKALAYLYDKDYHSSLIWELKRFIFRTNPQYYSYIDYYFDLLIFDPTNIDCINHLKRELEIYDITELFDESWDESDLKKQYLTKEETFSYLKRSLKCDDLDSLSDHFKDKYLDTADEYFNFSLYYYKKHYYLLSSEFFDYVLDYDQTHNEALYYESLSFIHLKDWQWAGTRIDEALKIKHDNSKYLTAKGIILFETGKKDEAIKYFKNALKINPNDSMIYNAIGVCYNHAGENNKALDYFNKAIDLSGEYIRPVLNKAKIHIGLKEYDKAEECFKQASLISDTDENYLIEKGCYNLIRKDFENAEKCFNECLKRHPKSVQVLELKYLSLYELGYKKEYNEYKNNLSKLDLLFVKKFENYLKD